MNSPNTEPITKRYLTDIQAAQITGLSRSWYQRMRWSGGGPEYIKLAGGAVRYDEHKLLKWFESKTRKSTSDNRVGK